MADGIGGTDDVFVTARDIHGNVTRTALRSDRGNMRTNRNNQPTFVVPIAAFRAADVPPFVGGFTRPCNRTGARVAIDRATFVAVTFGARVGRMIAATPAGTRAAVVVASVATERQLARHIAGRGHVGFVAYAAATMPDADSRSIADAVRTGRAQLRGTGTRAARAARMIADASAGAGSPMPDAIAVADSPTA